MTPDSTSPMPNPALFAESLFQFWMMPLHLAQAMFAASSSLAHTTGGDIAMAAKKPVARSEEAIAHIAEEAEEQIAKLDEHGDTLINPAALLS